MNEGAGGVDMRSTFLRNPWYIYIFLCPHFLFVRNHYDQLQTGWAYFSKKNDKFLDRLSQVPTTFSIACLPDQTFPQP